MMTDETTSRLWSVINNFDKYFWLKYDTRTKVLAVWGHHHINIGDN
jgi:hypothetical protein